VVESTATVGEGHPFRVTWGGGIARGSGAGSAAPQSPDTGIRECCLEVPENGLLVVAVNFLESCTVADCDFQNSIANFQGATVGGEFRADRLFPGVIEHVRGRPFKQSASADQALDDVPDGTWQSGEFVRETLQCECSLLEEKK